MEDYYSKQVYLPHFASYNRQRGGALAAGIGRVALPFAKNFVLPAAKKIGKKLLVQSVPEVFDVIAKRKLVDWWIGGLVDWWIGRLVEKANILQRNEKP